MKSLIGLIALAALAGCNGELPIGAQNAQDKLLPVALVICSTGERNCFVSARYSDFDSCKAADKWNSLNFCEWGSKSVTCNIPSPSETLAHGYCINKEETVSGLLQLKLKAALK